MKKIPTLFKRTFKDHVVTDISPELTSPDLQWVLDGEGIATEKIDGACCAVIDGYFFKRYDAKKGKTPSANAIPCCDPDPVTGHWPHWVPVTIEDPSSKWFLQALMQSAYFALEENGTYEAVGPHFNGNPYNIKEDTLVKHGDIVVNIPRTFEGIKEYLREHKIEGIVFWKDGEPKCKIKRSDFGFEWPVKKE